jgi:hypothetical protein
MAARFLGYTTATRRFLFRKTFVCYKQPSSRRFGSTSRRLALLGRAKSVELARLNSRTAPSKQGDINYTTWRDRVPAVRERSRHIDLPFLEGPRPRGPGAAISDDGSLPFGRTKTLSKLEERSRFQRVDRQSPARTTRTLSLQAH